jgi:transposase
MCPYRYYDVMRKSKDPSFIRHQMALSVEEIGIKATARRFHTSRNTVRKWHRRWIEKGYQGLQELSRRPHRSPHATPEEERRELVRLRAQYKRVGADTIKTIKGLERSARTIRKIWREEKVPRRPRPRKHRTKQNLRAVKRQWRLFQQICEDIKYLNDIPEYYASMMSKGLPRFQYTARDVTSGLLYLGFAQEESLTNTTLFARYLNDELTRRGADLSQTTRQTDNGSPYIGSVFAKEPSAYTRAIELVPGQSHATIPPAAYTWQSDVETVHNVMEQEFYEIENFADRPDFLDKAYSYQLFFNIERPNSYKENKTPWQLAREKVPDLPESVALIPPVFIEDLMEKDLENLTLGGHDVSSTP